MVYFLSVSNNLKNISFDVFKRKYSQKFGEKFILQEGHVVILTESTALIYASKSKVVKRKIVENCLTHKNEKTIFCIEISISKLTRLKQRIFFILITLIVELIAYHFYPQVVAN